MVTFDCMYCKGTFTKHRSSNGFYCSNKCQQSLAYDKYIEAWLSGEKPGWAGKTAGLSNFVRKWLRQTRGTACEICGWDDRHPIDGSILTEVDHIDGDAHNCRPNNLKILCPNCHAKTPTFRARNRNSKRHRR